MNELNKDQYLICRGIGWRIRRDFLLTFLAAVLAACGNSSDGIGGGDGGDGSGETGETPTAQTIGTFDVSKQPGLSAQSVVLNRSVQININNLADDEGVLLDFEPTDNTTISITLPQLPNATGIPVKLMVNGAVPSVANRSYAIYVYTPASADDDGGESLNPLESTYDPAASTVEAVLPDWAFVQTGNQFVARVKIGFVKTYNPPAAAGSSVAPGNLKAPLAVAKFLLAQMLECPLDECVETSQFNPSRRLGTQARAHKGVDFRAKIGTNLYVDAGAKVIRGWTPAKFSSLGSPIGQGVSIFFDYGAGLPRVAYFHLSGLDSKFIDPTDPKKVASVTTTSRTLVGQTGTSGTAATAPHLHMETSRPVIKNCQVQGPTGADSARATVCTLVYGQVNPLRYMIRSFVIDQPSSLYAEAPVTFTVKALDKGNRVIRSEVGRAVETLSGDPTRKVCFRDSEQVFNWKTSGASWIDSSQTPNLFCTEWQSAVTATRRAAGPTRVEARYSTAITKNVYDTTDSLVDSRVLMGVGFTKISATGQDLPPDANVWSCVRHNATGKLWEAGVRRETPEHWCTWNSAHRCFGYTNFGDNSAYEANKVPATVGSLCGKTGWRLPTAAEGRVLVSDPGYQSIAGLWTWDVFHFWFGSYDNAYSGWTSTPVAGSSGTTWTIHFSVGIVGEASRGNGYGDQDKVRLVAGP